MKPTNEKNSQLDSFDRSPMGMRRTHGRPHPQGALAAMPRVLSNDLRNQVVRGKKKISAGGFEYEEEKKGYFAWLLNKNLAPQQQPHQPLIHG